MILADIQTTINLTLMFLGLFIYFGVYIAFRVLRHLGRSVRDGYHKDGGASGMTKKVAARGAGEFLKRVILKR